MFPNSGPARVNGCTIVQEMPFCKSNTCNINAGDWGTNATDPSECYKVYHIVLKTNEANRIENTEERSHS